MSAPAATQQQTVEILPSPATLHAAAKLAIQLDKPILLDYYVDTATKKAALGLDETTGEKILVKSNEEFTSNIKRTYKADNDFIVLTENSIYVVSGKICQKKVSTALLHNEL
jgi:hypothetical protein